VYSDYVRKIPCEVLELTNVIIVPGCKGPGAAGRRHRVEGSDHPPACLQRGRTRLLCSIQNSE